MPLSHVTYDAATVLANSISICKASLQIRCLYAFHLPKQKLTEIGPL